MATTHPVETIAKLLILTERRVQQLAREGILPKAEHGRYELVPVVQAYAALQSLEVRWNRVLVKEKVRQQARELQSAQAVPTSMQPPPQSPAADRPAPPPVPHRGKRLEVRRSSWMS